MNEIINYVMDTPGNTNPNVLKGLLNKMDNGGSGYTIDETRMTVSPEFQEAVAKSMEPLVVPMTFTNPSNPLAGGTYDSTYYDKMYDAFTEGRQIMLEVPTMGSLQVINAGSTSGSAVFNCMTMVYFSNTYLLIVINLSYDGVVFVRPFTLTQPN